MALTPLPYLLTSVRLFSFGYLDIDSVSFYYSLHPLRTQPNSICPISSKTKGVKSTFPTPIPSGQAYDAIHISSPLLPLLLLTYLNGYRIIFL